MNENGLSLKVPGNFNLYTKDSILLQQLKLATLRMDITQTTELNELNKQARKYPEKTMLNI